MTEVALSTRRTEAQEIVRSLKEAGLTTREICDALENRVSVRTLYRWQKGASGPKNESTFQLLRQLADTHLSGKNAEQ